MPGEVCTMCTAHGWVTLYYSLGGSGHLFANLERSAHRCASPASGLLALAICVQTWRGLCAGIHTTLGLGALVIKVQTWRGVNFGMLTLQYWSVSTDHLSAHLERSVLGCVNLACCVLFWRWPPKLLTFLSKQRLVAIGCPLLASFFIFFVTFVFWLLV